jgi:aldehyde:ferredoxin oxidoreductase
MLVGERIYNLERYFNNQAGFDGSDDTLPDRFTKETGTGAAADSVCELDDMKVEYYAARGWDDGVAPESKLRELGILS